VHAPLAANAAEQTIIDLLLRSIIDTDELQAASNMNAQEFQQTLSMMEITAKIRPIGGGKWNLS
jgi:predicted Rossmann fold nucleotide-binding protein DprA/Smf involved in DNA uptake